MCRFQNCPWFGHLTNICRRYWSKQNIGYFLLVLYVCILLLDLRWCMRRLVPTEIQKLEFPWVQQWKDQCHPHDCRHSTVCQYVPETSCLIDHWSLLPPSVDINPWNTKEVINYAVLRNKCVLPKHVVAWKPMVSASLNVDGDEVEADIYVKTTFTLPVDEQFPRYTGGEVWSRWRHWAIR